MLNCVKTALGNFYHPVLHKIRCKKNDCLTRKIIAERIKSPFVNLESNRKKRIYLDMTSIYQDDRGTGIQRVAKKIAEGLALLSKNYDLVKVHFSDFTYKSFADNAEVDYQKGDIFFIPDYAIEYACNLREFYSALSRSGVKTVYFLHDILSLRMPEVFEAKAVRYFKKSFKTFLNFDLIICNSKATCDDLKAWLKENPSAEKNPQLKIDYSLLGSDFADSAEINQVTLKANDSITFLMVSTVEPRKMYDQAVSAFNLLWKENPNIKLEIVGRRGWKSDKTFKLIEENPHFGKELIWFDSGISDEELAGLYRKCDAVIFASLAEGFGLAVAEGAHYKKPLILRDIPVYKNNSHPKSEKIHLSSWKACSQKVLEILEGGEK